MNSPNSKGWVIWITGLPGSGKSTVARLLSGVLLTYKVQTKIISSDIIRKTLTPIPSYTDEEREIVYRAISFLAKILAENGFNVIIDATGNLRKYREYCRKELSRYCEVYLKCPLTTCMRREETRQETFYAPRNIYRKAKLGVSETIPGLGSPYEPPENPEITVNAEKLSPTEIVQIIIKKLSKFGMVNF